MNCCRVMLITILITLMYKNEVNEKLDKMVYDGTLSAIFNERFIGYVTPQMFGAVGDGITDDSVAIQMAFDYSERVVFPKGKYLFSGVTANKSMIIDFYDAELVPIYYDNTNNVFRNFFTFNVCKYVEINGLSFVGTPTTVNGVKVVGTESIVVFNECDNVRVNNWNIENIVLNNKTDTPLTFADRQGGVFTAIDTHLHIDKCTFKNIHGDEWVWVCYKRDTSRSSVDVTNTLFENGTGYSCVSALCGSGTIRNCVFKSVSYNGSLANLITLNSVFEYNAIRDCVVGSIIDCCEDAIGFADSVSINNNMCYGSVVDCFCYVASKVAYIKNNVVTCRSFLYTNAPVTGNILRNGVPSEIKMFIEGNIGECLGHDTLHSNRGFLYLGFEYESSVWYNGYSEVTLKNNTFYRSGNNKNNVCISCVDLSKLIAENNKLFFGQLYGTTAIRFNCISLSLTSFTSTAFELYNNTFDGRDISSNSTNNGVLITFGTVTNLELRAILNMMTNYVGSVIIYSGAYGNIVSDIKSNINIADMATV